MCPLQACLPRSPATASISRTTLSRLRVTWGDAGSAFLFSTEAQDRLFDSTARLSRSHTDALEAGEYLVGKTGQDVHGEAGVRLKDAAVDGRSSRAQGEKSGERKRTPAAERELKESANKSADCLAVVIVISVSMQ